MVLKWASTVPILCLFIFSHSTSCWGLSILPSGRLARRHFLSLRFPAVALCATARQALRWVAWGIHKQNTTRLPPSPRLRRDGEASPARRVPRGIHENKIRLRAVRFGAVNTQGEIHMKEERSGAPGDPARLSGPVGSLQIP